VEHHGRKSSVVVSAIKASPPSHPQPPPQPDPDPSPSPSPAPAQPQPATPRRARLARRTPSLIAASPSAAAPARRGGANPPLHPPRARRFISQPRPQPNPNLNPTPTSTQPHTAAASRAAAAAVASRAAVVSASRVAVASAASLSVAVPARRGGANLSANRIPAGRPPPPPPPPSSRPPLPAGPRPAHATHMAPALPTRHILFSEPNKEPLEKPVS